jgi:hypothetical protein
VSVALAPSQAPGGLSSFVGRLRALALAQVNAEKRRREEGARRLREAIAEAFEATGDPRFCIRRLEVVEHVAKALGVLVTNEAFFVEVTRVATELGFQPSRSATAASTAAPSAGTTTRTRLWPFRGRTGTTRGPNAAGPSGRSTPPTSPADAPSRR